MTTTSTNANGAGRRKRGAGGLRQLPSGTWEISYRHTPGGKPVTERWPDQEAAEARLEQVMRFLRGGRGDELRLTFGDYAAMWLSATRPTNDNLEAWSGWDKRRGIVERHLIPAFRDDLMTTLTPEALQDYLEAKRVGDLPGLMVKGREPAPLSAQSLVHHRALLRQIFEHAITVKRLPLGSNPATPLVVSSPSPETTSPLDLDDINALMAQMDPDHDALVTLLWSQGLRLGEALALRWSDYDEETRSLDISRSLKRDARTDRQGGPMWRAGKTKTKAGVRGLTLDEVMHEVLCEHRANLGDQATANSVMFPARTGNHLNQSNFRQRVFRPALAELLIKRCTPAERAAITASAQQSPVLERLAESEKTERAHQLLTAAVAPLVELLALGQTTVRHLVEAKRDGCDLDAGTLVTRAPDGSECTIKLTASAVAALRVYVETTASQSNKLGWLFIHSKGAHIGQDTVLRTVVWATIEAHRSEVMTSVHGLRAAYATIQIEENPSITPAKLADALGHSRTSITWDRYTRLWKSKYRRREVTSVAALVRSKTKSQ